MRNHPYTDISGRTVLLVIPFFCLLIWLFNAHRMGKISKKQYRLYSIVAGILLLGGLIITLRIGR
ncbi:MAG: hypothetical protein IJF79_07640 [Clostridia bacterium]|nr:hypothetical protein [Clostridia bacterium]